MQNINRNVYNGKPIEAINEMLDDIDYLDWLRQNASSDHVAQKRWENVQFLLNQLA